MIRINLLPAGMGRKAAAFPLADLPWRRIGIGCASLLVFYSGILFFSNQRQAASLARLRAEWGELQPRKAHLDQIQAALHALQNREMVLKTLKAPDGRWAPRMNLLSDCIVSDLWFSGFLFRTTPIADILSFKGEFEGGDALPNFAPETEETVNADGSVGPPADWKPQMFLRGFALVTSKEGSPVSRFMQRLKEHPEFNRWFSGIELRDVGHSQVGRQEISEFAILLYPTGQQ